MSGVSSAFLDIRAKFSPNVTFRSNVGCFTTLSDGIHQLHQDTATLASIQHAVSKLPSNLLTRLIPLCVTHYPV